MRVQRIDRDDGPIHLRFGGIVTDETSQESDSALLSSHEYGQQVLVSLRDVTLLNSSGIGMLLKMNRALHDQGGAMVVLDVPMSVRQVLDFMKLGKVLKIAENERFDVRGAHDWTPGGGVRKAEEAGGGYSYPRGMVPFTGSK